MKRYAFAALWVALFAQVGWVILNRVVLHRSPGLDLTGALVTGFFVAFAALYGRWRWMAVIARVIMSADFLLSVGDRFGVLGSPGAPGVSWGDFGHFIAYTRSVNSFLPPNLAPTLAVLATIAEVGLGVALLLGVRPQFAALGAASLLLIYGISMTISLPPAQQFHYFVYVLCAGMLALATVDASALSVDKLVLWWRGRLAAHRPQSTASA